MNKISLSVLFILLVVLSSSAQLRVSENQRYLQTADGKPFFWLGDTAWELFHRLTREEAEKYLKNRADKGFTVIQAVALAELDGLRDPNPYRSEEHTSELQSRLQLVCRLALEKKEA